MPQEIVRYGEPSTVTPIDLVGGKGYNLLKLADLSKGSDFIVPPFYIIPVGFQYSDPRLKELFELLPKPLAVRSSSPHEDSKGFSFAGRFKSFLDVEDFQGFQTAIGGVLDSAADIRVKEYAQQHGLPVDERMAVIIQEMVRPLYSGVCYSTFNPNNPKTIIEFTGGLADELMAGNRQGSLASFDKGFNLTMEHGDELPDLERVAGVAQDLERIFNERLDIEFAVSKDRQIYIVQARPITDPAWPDIQIPEIDPSKTILEADIVRGSGLFSGPVFVFRSPTEMERYAKIHNKQPMIEINKQWHKLKEFNSSHPEGYCLIADNLEAHEIMMQDRGLKNVKALVMVDFASRFSHPIKIVSETGAFYLGAFGKKDLLDTIDTGDTISVTSNQSKGVVFDLTKPKVEFRKANLENTPVVQFGSAMQMLQPDYEDVDDHLYTDESGKIGILFIDYNDQNGKPDDVFYDVIVDGLIVEAGRYEASRTITRHQTFSSLLNSLLAEAKNKMGKK